ncbi:LysR family transcriptional regulator [Methylobacterium pseudosasicola]|uniref:Transcriptional regulator, LysR family n=1 Tax=Methylobacterium pseudosasicola TaxID=582667 RepID=A0A1I4NJU6_9HYPH|nr:LysR family transcriptional regulator [Methylobacterium pseudosasicola]SFM15736.1 transcriptional regulator, LysR family [Methylobacterium pseudosasicola]
MGNAHRLIDGQSTMQFDFVSLRLFAAVVEHRNIAQASRLHNIAASAVSKRISDLEARTGTALLYRLREGVEPTPAGHALYRYAKLMARTADELQAELSTYAEGEKGHVRLWANTSAVTQFLPEDLAVFTQQFPDVRIELREDTSQRIVDAVKDGFADIGVYSDHIGPVDLCKRTYRRDTLMVVVPTGHALAGRQAITLEETSAYDHVGLQEGSSLQARVMEESARLGLPVRMRVQVFGFDSIRRMVEAGLGIAILPQGAVLPYLVNNKLVALELRDAWASRSLMAAFRDEAALPRSARALLACLCPDA